MSQSSLGSGHTANTAERQILLTHRLTPRNGTRKGVLMSHGRGSGTFNAVAGASAQTDPVIDVAGHALADAGFIVAGQDNWQLGHFTADPALSRLLELKTWLQTIPTTATNGGGAATGKAVLRGFSQGGGMSIYAALQNPSLYSCMVISCPMVSIKDIHDNNRAGYASEIETAFGSPAAYTAAADQHDGLTRAAELQGFPILIYYSDNDPVIMPSLVQQFATLSGAEIHSLGSVGHYDGAIDTERVTAFVRANA